MSIFKKIGKGIIQYRHLIICILIGVLCFLYLCSDPSGRAAQRKYERTKIENRIQIEKAQTDKELAIIEAEKEAEVLRIKGGISTESDYELP